MSFVITTDVFCDGENCGQWIHGVSTYQVAKNTAKRNARQNKWLITPSKHYCPYCVEKLTKENKLTDFQKNKLCGTGGE